VTAILIALDLGCATGYAVSSSGALQSSGTLKLPQVAKVGAGGRLSAFAGFLRFWLPQVSALYYEKPIPMTRLKTRNELAQHLVAVIQLEAYRAAVPVFGVAIQQAKAAVYGGRATKEEVRSAVDTWYSVRTSSQDEADALAVLRWAEENSEVTCE